mmetsp:Transcript_55996/g.67214  ORF Transcript_55996/g.67214 Transcript_55996/m.67214 type:complete len:170 (+) Transcript_55996:1337-1846(+)
MPQLLQSQVKKIDGSRLNLAQKSGRPPRPSAPNIHTSQVFNIFSCDSNPQTRPPKTSQLHALIPCSIQQPIINDSQKCSIPNSPQSTCKKRSIINDSRKFAGKTPNSVVSISSKIPDKSFPPSMRFHAPLVSSIKMILHPSCPELSANSRTHHNATQIAQAHTNYITPS